MNKKILAIGAIAFIMGVSANYALSKSTTSANPAAPAGFNVAVVDVQKVVSESAQVKALKEEQKAKNQEMINFVENAKKEITKETDKTKQKALEDKYTAQLSDMQKAMDSGYKKKLTEIDNNITKVIQKTAQDKGYKMVLAKSIVLYGGVDITKEVAKAVK